MRQDEKGEKAADRYIKLLHHERKDLVSGEALTTLKTKKYIKPDNQV